MQNASEFKNYKYQKGGICLVVYGIKYKNK
jgi:hypothetical protein